MVIAMKKNGILHFAASGDMRARFPSSEGQSGFG